MSDVLLKYKLLNKSARQEVNDFLDFLLSKQKTEKNKPVTAYKKKILNVSTWSESDLNVFKESDKMFNNWRVQEC